MAPGAFERAHSSPRADADAGPAGGTAPDSPRAFLAAMEDGVYGRPGEADRRAEWLPSPAKDSRAVARRLSARGTGFRHGPEPGVPGHCLGRALFRRRRRRRAGRGSESGAGRTPALARAWLSGCKPWLYDLPTDPDPGSGCLSLASLCTPDSDHGARSQSLSFFLGSKKGTQDPGPPTLPP